MYPETNPIIFKCPKEFDYIEILPIHDTHFGNRCCDMKRYFRLRDYIMDKPNRFCVWVGDLMENALPGSKSDPLEQTMSPFEQQELVIKEFTLLKDRSIAIVDGNHEANRSLRFAGLYPLFTAAAIAGISDRFRSAYAVADISVGTGADGHEDRQQRYVGYITHQAKNTKNMSVTDFLEGFDFAFFGHDHDVQSHPREHLVYDRKAKSLSQKSIVTVDCGSYLTFGGYGARGAYKPQSNRGYKVFMYGGRHERIEPLEFDPRYI